MPHYNVTAALALALACVAALVYFLAHATRNINMTQTINLLRGDMYHALKNNTLEHEPAPLPRPAADFWQGGEALRFSGHGGYLQLLDTAALVQSAQQAGCVVRLFIRPGQYVYPNTVIAVGQPHLPPNVLNSLTLGSTRTTDQDPEYAIRKLTEVAARALSPGTNDPVTAMDILDRFGDALCALRGRHWPLDTQVDDQGQLRLVRPTVGFEDVAHQMFEMIRQYGAENPEVMLHMLRVLGQIVTCQRDEQALGILRQHVQAVYQDAQQAFSNPRDLRRLESAYCAALRSFETGLPQ